MKPTIINLKIFMIFCAGLFLCACEKESAEQPIDVIYSVAVEGYTATFNNETAGAKSYRWDFGDGESSTEASPVHTYPGKGKYVPTLYATMNDGQVVEGSTVLRISKSSAIKMEDHTLSDWDTVSHNVVTAGPGGGIFRKAKYDYDGNYIYFYFEIASTVANEDIFDFYMDTDNNPATGLSTGLFTNAGFDVLLEGIPLGGWFDVFYHKGAQNEFSFDYQSINDFYKIGTVSESGGILAFEGSISRAKIKGLVGTGFKIGVSITKNDWSATLGNSPDDSTPAFFMNMTD